jgi:hypothetical protein
MKALIVLAMTIFTASTHAQDRVSDHCGGREACTVGRSLFEAGDQYARGHAANCQSAIADAQEVFTRHFRTPRNCGPVHRSPYSIGCAQTTSGVTAIVKCSPTSRNPLRRLRSGCALVGGRLVC